MILIISIIFLLIRSPGHWLRKKLFFYFVMSELNKRLLIHEFIYYLLFIYYLFFIYLLIYSLFIIYLFIYYLFIYYLFIYLLFIIYFFYFFSSLDSTQDSSKFLASLFLISHARKRNIPRKSFLPNLQGLVFLWGKEEKEEGSPANDILGQTLILSPFLSFSLFLSLSLPFIFSPFSFLWSTKKTGRCPKTCGATIS